MYGRLWFGHDGYLFILVLDVELQRKSVRQTMYESSFCDLSVIKSGPR